MTIIKTLDDVKIFPCSFLQASDSRNRNTDLYITKLVIESSAEMNCFCKKLITETDFKKFWIYCKLPDKHLQFTGCFVTSIYDNQVVFSYDYYNLIDKQYFDEMRLYKINKLRRIIT